MGCDPIEPMSRSGFSVFRACSKNDMKLAAEGGLRDMVRKSTIDHLMNFHAPKVGF